MAVWRTVTVLAVLVGVVGCSKPQDQTAAKPGASDLQTTQPKLKDRAITPDQSERLAADAVHERMTKGDALLVCAYENDVVFKAAKLEGAISIQDFRARLSKLRLAQEIIFYCS